MSTMTMAQLPAAAFLSHEVAATQSIDERTEARRLAAVRRAREADMSWGAIGAVFGVSRQAAWERFHARVDEAGDRS